MTADMISTRAAAFDGPSAIARIYTRLTDVTQPLSTRFDPEDLREELRAYQNAVSGVVARYDGFVAKYMGDGVLAYFGYSAGA